MRQSELVLYQLAQEVKLCAQRTRVRLSNRQCEVAVVKARNMVSHDDRFGMLPGEFDAMIVVRALDDLGVPDLEADDDQCHAGRDGDCVWALCPQLRDGEPKRSGRHCPIDRADEEA